MEKNSQLFRDKDSNEGESQAHCMSGIAVGTGMIHMNHGLAEDTSQ